MKKLTLAALMAYAGLVGVNAHAAGESADFNVLVNLTSKCQINGGDTATLNDITLNYTSFQAGPASGTTSFDLKCTQGLSYGLVFAPASGSALGLNYTLAHNAGGTGLAAGETVTVTASIAGGEVGSCAGASCSATVPHTLTVTY